jgi:hypothetical protein
MVRDCASVGEEMLFLQIQRIADHGPKKANIMLRYINKGSNF